MAILSDNEIFTIYSISNIETNYKTQIIFIHLNTHINNNNNIVIFIQYKKYNLKFP